MKSRTEKQHYIPNRSYLDYFIDNSLDPPALWVYFNKKEVLEDASTANYKNIAPINLCKESYLYETPRLPVNAIENALAEIEGNYKKVLDNKIIPNKKLSAEDKLAISYFLSTLEVRTPLNKENSDEFINDMREQVVHLEEAMGNSQKSQLHQELDDAERQNIMFTQTLAVAFDVNRFGSVDMLFLSPQFDGDDSFFITSDFPVTMVDFTMMNSFYPPTPMDTTVEVIIPLTPKIALFVNNIGLNGYKQIDYNFVREINNRVLRRSNKFIISPKKLDKDFSFYTVNRAPQSFVLLFLSEELGRKRRARMDRWMKSKLVGFIKTLIKKSKTICFKRIKSKKFSIKLLELYAGTKEEYSWFLKVLEMLGNAIEQNQSTSVTKLKKPINTLSLVKVVHTNTVMERGCIYFSVKEYPVFKNNFNNKKGFKTLTLDDKEYVELREEKFDTLIRFSD
jgi:hypothetical protein